MKTRLVSPFIGKIIQEDGREQWYVMWRGEEYGKFNTYDAAQKQAAQLQQVDKNGRF